MRPENIFAIFVVSILSSTEKHLIDYYIMLGQTFRVNSHLADHYDSHHSNTNHTCAYCDQRCKTKRSLRQHIQTRHTNVNDYVCAICGKGYGIRSRLTVILFKLYCF